MKFTTALILGVFTTASAGVMADHRHHVQEREWTYAQNTHYYKHYDKKYHKKVKQHQRKAKKHYRIARAHESLAQHQRYRYDETRSRTHYGRVTGVEPVYRTYQKPVRHDSCLRQDSNQRAYTSHTATILGAVIGGTLGHRIGDSGGDADAAAIAGGILGASIGHDLGQRYAYNRTLRVEGPCRVRHEAETVRELVEYQVTYRYNGQTHQARMDHDPGEWIKLDIDVSPV